MISASISSSSPSFGVKEAPLTFDTSNINTSAIIVHHVILISDSMSSVHGFVGCNILVNDIPGLLHEPR